jgi:hypothetical protein
MSWKLIAEITSIYTCMAVTTSNGFVSPKQEASRREYVSYWILSTGASA